MKGARTALCLIYAAMVAGGCEGLKQDLGIGVKRPPDEFAVYTRAPLSLPPDYSLRPPKPGAATESMASRNSARDVLFDIGSGRGNAAPAVAAPEDASPGLTALLGRTGALTATSDIREQVNRESTVLADADRSFIERLMFWSDKPPEGTVVNAPEESRRIRENQALGKPIVVGETPTIERRPKALLEGIFN